MIFYASFFGIIFLPSQMFDEIFWEKFLLFRNTAASLGRDLFSFCFFLVWHLYLSIFFLFYELTCSRWSAYTYSMVSLMMVLLLSYFNDWFSNMCFTTLPLYSLVQWHFWWFRKRIQFAQSQLNVAAVKFIACNQRGKIAFSVISNCHHDTLTGNSMHWLQC